MQRDPIVLGALSLALCACTVAAPTTVADSPATLDLAAPVESATPAAASGNWPSAAGCGDLVGRLAELDKASADRLEMDDAPLVLIAADADAPMVQRTLPIPDASPTTAVRPACAIVLGGAVPSSATGDRVLERRTVHSAYPTGVKRRRNPEHVALEKKLAKARRDPGDELSITSTGDPLMDLVGTVASGIIGGIGTIWQLREVRAIEAELAATPAFIEDKIMTPYSFELVDVEAERQVIVPIALHDETSGAMWATSVTLTERRQVAVADERHPNDTTPQITNGASMLTSVELARWLESTPSIGTDVLLTHLAAASRRQPEQPTTLAATIAQLRETAAASETVLAIRTGADRQGSWRPPSREPRSREPGSLTDPTLLVEPAAGPLPASGTTRAAQAVVSPFPTDAALLHVGDAGLPGFYVTSEHILTPASALGSSSLVAVRHADGMRAHGLVELVDESLGLALVFLPRAGRAMPIRQAQSTAPAAQGQQGIPWTNGEQVVGVFVSNPSGQGQHWVDGAAIDRFLVRLAEL